MLVSSPPGRGVSTTAGTVEGRPFAERVSAASWRFSNNLGTTVGREEKKRGGTHKIVDLVQQGAIIKEVNRH